MLTLGLGPAPARIPYFDGDFWPMEAEELLLDFWKEAEKIKNDAAEAIAEEGRSTRKKRRVYVKSLLYMLVVLVVSLPVPTTAL